MSGKELVIAAVAVLVTAAAAGAFWQANQNEWEKRVERVETLAEVFRGEADRLRAEADSIESKTDTVRIIITKQDSVIREAEAAVDTTPVPAGCEVAVGVRDRLISECQLQVANVKEALGLQTEAAAKLRAAAAKSAERADSLASVLADRPKPKPSWLPDVGAGPFAGICMNGQLCYGLGVQLSWKVSLF